MDVRNNFEPVYVPLEGKAETLKRLKKLSQSCSRILLATGTYSCEFVRAIKDFDFFLLVTPSGHMM